MDRFEVVFAYLYFISLIKNILKLQVYKYCNNYLYKYD